MQRTKSLKLKTNNADIVSLAHPATRPGYQAQLSAFVVAVERVPSHLQIAVVTAYMWAVVDVPFPTLDHEVSAR